MEGNATVRFARRTFCGYFSKLFRFTLVSFMCSTAIQSGMALAVSASSIPQAGDAIKEGDQIRFSADSPIFRAVGESDAKYCAPAGSRFAIDHVNAGKKSVEGVDSTGKKLTPTVTTMGSSTSTTFSSAATITQVDSGTIYNGHFPRYGTHWYDPLHWLDRLGIISSVSEKSCIALPNEAPSKTPPQSSASQDVVVAGGQYDVAATDLNNYGIVRSGLTWGGLVIPYKYEFKADHSFQSAPSIAAYFGWAGWIPGASAATVLVAGGGAVSVPASSTTGAANGATTSTSTQAVYTVGLGELATFGGAFKAGLVVGKDYSGRNTGFKYDGATWLALTIGAGF